MFGRPRVLVFRINTRSAAWSLGMDRFPKVLNNMGVAMEVACFSHRKIGKRSIKPGQRAYN